MEVNNTCGILWTFQDGEFRFLKMVDSDDAFGEGAKKLWPLGVLAPTYYCYDKHKVYKYPEGRYDPSPIVLPNKKLIYESECSFEEAINTDCAEDFPIDEYIVYPHISYIESLDITYVPHIYGQNFLPGKITFHSLDIAPIYMYMGRKMCFILNGDKADTICFLDDHSLMRMSNEFEKIISAANHEDAHEKIKALAVDFVGPDY